MSQNIYNMIHYIQHTTSTNDDARSDSYGHMDVVWAGTQSAGRGQRGHTWHSREGENLTFSVVLTPDFLHATQQFLLSEIAALSLVDTLAEYNIDCRIKWTNDIYAGDCKIAGILIEHSLSGENLRRTIVGIGLNVNQLTFPEDLPNPTSMSIVRNAKFEPREVLECFVRNLERWFETLRHGNNNAIEVHYHNTLYHRDECHTYALPSGEQFEATIRGVRSTGHLCLEHGDGTLHEYAFKEVEFVLPAKKLAKNF